MLSKTEHDFLEYGGSYPKSYSYILEHKIKKKLQQFTN